MMSNEELIAEARDYAAACRLIRHGTPTAADLIDALSDALEQSTPHTDSAYLQSRERAAFALYKSDNPESVAENFETVGLPIVLRYREKAEATLVAAGFGRLPVVETVTEWEYGFNTGSTVTWIGRQDQIDEYCLVRGWKLGQGDMASRIERRRAAGPWLPIEDGSDHEHSI